MCPFLRQTSLLQQHRPLSSNHPLSQFSLRILLLIPLSSACLIWATHIFHQVKLPFFFIYIRRRFMLYPNKYRNKSYYYFFLSLQNNYSNFSSTIKRTSFNREGGLYYRLQSEVGGGWV
jgi:hypothetical protein